MKWRVSVLYENIVEADTEWEAEELAREEIERWGSIHADPIEEEEK